MTEENNPIVYVRSAGANGASKTVYHTDKDCARIQAAKGIAEKPLNVLHDDIEKCRFCDGDAPVNSGDYSHIMSLRQAAKQQSEGAKQ